MLKELIKTQVSVKEIAFKPGSDPVSFEVSVLNHSTQFATFQLELLAAGVDEVNHQWYRLSPEVCSKTPSGDRTTFQVKILRNPIPGFVGQINLTVRVFSLDLATEMKQSMRLTLEQGSEVVPLVVDLLLKKIQTYSGDLIELIVRTDNPGQVPVRATLRLQGLDPEWFAHGVEQAILVQAGRTLESIFLCQPPSETTQSQVYPFQVEAEIENGSSSNDSGTLEILPTGTADFRCTVRQKKIPLRLLEFLKLTGKATYLLELENASNVSQDAHIEVDSSFVTSNEIEVIPELAELHPYETQQFQLMVKKRRSWIGSTQTGMLSVRAVCSDTRIRTQNELQALELKVAPMISVWWLSAIAFFTVPFPLWVLSCYNPQNPQCGHLGTVSSVQFNGTAEQAITGANDQAVRRWLISGFFNPLISQEMGVVSKTNQAVRVIRYQSIDNNRVAAGLENGEIQLLNLLKQSSTPDSIFRLGAGDRVFDLRFSNDSEFLFSGHGSGAVAQWKIGNANLNTKPEQTLRVDFAVSALALVGESQQLAIAGRFNRLELWDWNRKQHKSIRYPTPGGQNQYIQSLASTKAKPNLMASADNQGTITLWNLKECLDSKQPCQIIEQWSDGHSNQPVRSVAFSPNGCYLASGGADGTTKLWALSPNGRRAEHPQSGKVIQKSLRSTAGIESVDVAVVHNQVLVLSGSADTQVRVDQVDRFKNLECDRD
jgi:WD40 repeat protein